MQAAICRTFAQPLSIETVALADPGPGEVRVRIAACAVCHSDIFFAEGAWGGTLPAVYGHEAAGIVEAVGPGVSRLAKGDHAIVTLVRSCGACSCCSQGFYGSCTSEFPLDANTPLTFPDGTPIVHGLGTAAFAEACVVDVSQVVKIPRDMPFAQASLLACGVITGFGAVTNSAKLRPGSSAVVIGTGGVGLNAVQGASLAGARQIIALDVSDDKLATARTFGATDAVNVRTGNAVDAVRELTGGAGADYVFVTVGAGAAFEQAFGMVTTGGAVVVVGMPPSGVMAQIDPGTIAGSSIRILGSKMGASNIHVDLPNLVAMYQNGRLKLDELITRTYPLEDINAAIATVNSGEALRNVIVFPG